MVENLSNEQITELSGLLNNRLEILWQEIRSEIAERDEQQLSKLPGEIHDFEEASVSDIYAELNLVVLEHHQQELVALRSALKRIEGGSYGSCIDCGEPIGYERLKAYPTAPRCIQCQQIIESS